MQEDPLEKHTLLKLEKLEKGFVQGGQAITIFQDLSLKIEAGQICALVGPSGSGKSTLLQIAGLLDKPTGGRVKIAGQYADTLSDAKRTRLRRDFVGFIYQFHHLLPEFSAAENVAMPQIIAGVPHAEALKKGEEILATLGLGHRLKHRPAQLSGGEQQRVAIARALVNRPQLLLADEPTGNLDPATSKIVFSLLVEEVRKRGIGALIATHNLSIADQMDKIFELKSGQIISY